MDHQEIKAVMEINGDINVTKFLAAGWVLLATAKKRDGDTEWVSYSMGWPKALPEVIPQGTSYA